ncbi:Telomerase protein component 1 [Mortierella hygrophila]|uniref:Telomerase protein component 1 n=1 Tax=Mortierella hygrophila TaxID=979708 RepID=A0A9P6K2V6_9FUNG|nr:Telomerase protein component 1 [Mortierella hygrophila]
MEDVQFGELPHLEEYDAVKSCSYSPNLLLFAVGSDSGGITLYNASTWAGVKALRGHSGEVNNLVFSPDSQRLASVGDDAVRVWDCENGEALLVLEGHIGKVSSVTFSPHGKYLASVGDDKTVRLWSLETGEILFISEGYGEAVGSVEFTADGLQLVSGCEDGTNQFRDVQTGEPGMLWASDHGEVKCLAVSPDGLRIATGHRGGHSGRVVVVAYSPDGETVISGSDDGSVRRWRSLWGSEDGRVLELSSGEVKMMALSQDRTQVATANAEPTICLWDLQTGAPGPILEGHSNDVLALAYSPCGRWIASSDRDNSIRLWNLHNVEQGHVLVKTDAGSRPISHFAFASTGHQLAISDLSGAVRVYDTQTRTLLKTITLEGVEASILTYSPTDQQLAVGTASRDSIHLWDLKSDESIVQLGLNDAVSDGVKCIAFSPCGNWIASGYAGDKTVRLWHRRHLQSGNAAGRGEVGSWRSVPMQNRLFDTVTSIAWNPVNSLEIVTCSQDRSVRVWRILDHGDGKDFTVRMLWGTNLGQLHVSGSVFGNVVGLEPVYERLLVQGGGVNESWSMKEEVPVSEE